MGLFDFADFQVSSSTDWSLPVETWPEIPSYQLAPSPTYGNLTIPASITAPDTSGWFGGIGDVFSSAGASISSGASGVTNSIANWFSTPSNSNQSVLQQAAGATQATGGIIGTVSNWFKGTSSAPNKNSATVASGQNQSGLGVLGALKALIGTGPPPVGQQSMTQAMGSGLSNILSPLKSTLFIMLLVLIAGWFLMGRLQRV